VGAEALSLREYVAALRAAMGLPPARSISVPRPFIELSARLGGYVRAPLDVDTWHMLERGTTADPSATQQLLGHPPRQASALIAPQDREQALRQARPLPPKPRRPS
jgi:hypothetical protein